ncbi:hypothetical protein AAHB37_17390 [Glutamicibacter halophytocola]|uniref:hypothetical protein n=1 Tax=Glutamicibacter halophytocola TaxID=1933880 RepID=UPI00321B50F6
MAWVLLANPSERLGDVLAEHHMPGSSCLFGQGAKPVQFAVRLPGIGRDATPRDVHGQHLGPGHPRRLIAGSAQQQLGPGSPRRAPRSPAAWLAAALSAVPCCSLAFGTSSATQRSYRIRAVSQ